MTPHSAGTPRPPIRTGSPIPSSKTNAPRRIAKDFLLRAVVRVSENRPVLHLGLETAAGKHSRPISARVNSVLDKADARATKAAGGAK